MQRRLSVAPPWESDLLEEEQVRAVPRSRILLFATVSVLPFTGCLAPVAENRYSCFQVSDDQLAQLAEHAGAALLGYRNDGVWDQCDDGGSRALYLSLKSGQEFTLGALAKSCRLQPDDDDETYLCTWDAGRFRIVREDPHLWVTPMEP